MPTAKAQLSRACPVIEHVSGKMCQNEKGPERILPGAQRPLSCRVVD